MLDTRLCYSPGQMHLEGDVVIEVRECDAILGPNWLANDDLVDIVELVPVLVSAKEETRQNETRHW